MRKKISYNLLAILAVLLVTLSSCSLENSSAKSSDERVIPVPSSRSMDEAEPWEIGKAYQTGDVVLFRESAFVVVQGHTSLATWMPPEVPALFELVRPSDPVYILWQPGMKLMRGEHLIDGNRVWEVNQDHTSAKEWPPAAVPALYREISATSTDVITPPVSYTFPKTGNMTINAPTGFTSDYTKEFYQKWKEKYIQYTYNRQWVVTSPQCGGVGYWVVKKASAYLMYNPVMAYYDDKQPNNQMIKLESNTQDANGHVAMTTSESHGYAMLAAAYMNDQELFDLLVSFYENFKSLDKDDNETELMRWQVWSSAHNYAGNRATSIQYRSPWAPDISMFYAKDKSSATDGDMDIAYALLLADKQWDKPEYKAQAIKVMDDILEYDIYSKGVESNTSHIKTGNWCSDDDIVTKYGYTWNDGFVTRPSDFLLDHLKAFASADPDTASKWNNVYNTTKNIILGTLADHKTAGGTSTGLLPDFMIYDESLGKYKTVEHKVMEPKDMYWYFNAARSMWRIGIEAGKPGNTELLNFIKTFTSWAESSMKAEWDLIKDNTGADSWPTEGGTFYATFEMDGTIDPDGYYYTKYSLSTAMLAASIGNGNSEHVRNKIWSLVLKPKGLGSDKFHGTNIVSGDYYGDTVQMMSLIALSDGWWTPLY